MIGVNGILDDQEFEVETILKKQHRGRTTQYLLKWKDYPIEDASWVNKKDCQGCTDLVQAFEGGDDVRTRSLQDK